MQPTLFNAVLDIRPVDETTQEQARTLILSGLGEHFGYINEALNQDLNDIIANYVEKGHVFLIGAIGNDVVCTGALVQEDQSAGRVVRMSVAKEYRRQGFGTAMLQRLTDLAREKGYRKLLVETNNDWHDAIGFYRQFGFVEYDRDEISVYMSISSNLKMIFPEGDTMSQRPKVLLYEPMHQKGIDYLKTYADVLYASGWDEDVLCQEVKDISGIIIRANGKVTARIMDRAPKLKVIGRHGAGVDNIDLEAAKERGITVVNTPHAPAEAVAEHVIGCMVVLSKRILESDRALRSGQWDVRYHFHAFEMKGKTLGIVGMGRIGSRVAEIAKAIGMEILYYDVVANPQVEEKYGAQKIKLEELLKLSDYITLHVPATPETKYLINAERLKLMKPTTILVNAARGTVVDTMALYDALKSGKLFGAAIDVFEKEPAPAGHPLFSLPNVVVTPHMAGHSDDALIAMSMVAKDIIRVLQGQPPEYPVK